MTSANTHCLRPIPSGCSANGPQLNGCIWASASLDEAVQLDEKNPYARYALAIVSNYADEFALALRSAEKAVELSPSFALAALYSGNASLAVQSLEHGLRLNRYDPQNFVWYNILALPLLPERALSLRPGAPRDLARPMP